MNWAAGIARALQWRVSTWKETGIASCRIIDERQARTAVYYSLIDDLALYLYTYRNTGVLPSRYHRCLAKAPTMTRDYLRVTRRDMSCHVALLTALMPCSLTSIPEALLLSILSTHTYKSELATRCGHSGQRIYL